MEEQQVEQLIGGSIIILVGLIVFFRVKRAQFWSEKGITATARVTNIIDTGATGHTNISFSLPIAGAWFSSSGIIWDLYLEIEQPGLPFRRLNIYHRFKDGYEPPQVGDILNILAHPKNPDKIIILPRDMVEQ